MDQVKIGAAKNELFSYQERTAFWKKKWKRDHLPGILAQIVLLLAAAVVLWFWKEAWRVFIIDIAVLGLMVLCLFHRNQMMIYVDHKLYD